MQQCRNVKSGWTKVVFVFLSHQGEKIKERLTPILNLLTESCRAHRETRKYIRKYVRPPTRTNSSVISFPVLLFQPNVFLFSRSCLLSETFHICQKRAPRWKVASSVSWLIWILMSSTVLLTSSLSSARRTVWTNTLGFARWDEIERVLFVYFYSFECPVCDIRGNWSWRYLKFYDATANIYIFF